jgi:hypothetical protein
MAYVLRTYARQLVEPGARFYAAKLEFHSKATEHIRKITLLLLTLTEAINLNTMKKL